MRTRSMKAKAFSIFLDERSPRRSRSSCRYMPWNFTSWASSSTIEPVIASRMPSASVPRRYSLASLMRSLRESSLAMGGSGPSFRGPREAREPGIHAQCVALDSGFAAARRPGMTRLGWISIRILQIPLAALELNHRLLGRVGGERFYVRIGAHERGAHVLRHRLGVAADIEEGALVEPLDELAAALPQPVLNIDLLRLVARERDVHAGERAVLD